MSVLSKFSLLACQKGLLREATVDEGLAPQDTVQYLQNLNCDRIGALQLRKGLTLLGSQISSGNAILGMANYRDNAGATYRMLAKVNTEVYAYNGTSWSSVRSGLTSNSKASFTNFIDLIYMVNGNGNEALQTYNGTTFGVSNVGSLPNGDFVENFRSRIWVADNSTDKLYYSNVVSTSQTITGGASYIQISPQDGEKITGLKRNPDALLVFKQNHIYRVLSINSADPDPAILLGTYSNDSIVEGKDGIYYHHPTGFYKYPQTDISRPIIDIIQAIPRSYYENVVGWFNDNSYYWSIGDITLEGVSLTNIVCRWTVSTQVWTVYSYGSEIRSAGLYDDGTNLFPLVGDNDGNVLKFNSGTTDNGSPIHYDLITHWYYFTSTKSTVKTISEIGTLHENAQGASLSYQLDTDQQSKWRPIGQITKDLYQVNKLNAVSFTRIRFRLSGNSVGSPFIFRGWEILSSLTDGEIKKHLSK